MTNNSLQTNVGKLKLDCVNITKAVGTNVGTVFIWQEMEEIVSNQSGKFFARETPVAIRIDGWMDG